MNKNIALDETRTHLVNLIRTFSRFVNSHPDKVTSFDIERLEGAKKCLAKYYIDNGEPKIIKSNENS